MALDPLPISDNIKAVLIANMSETDGDVARQNLSDGLADEIVLAAETAAGDVDWTTLPGKPSTFPPSAHTHTIGNVTGLQAALDVRTGHPNYVAGRFWYNTLTIASPSASAGTYTTGTTQYYPFMVWGKTTVNALRLRVQTAATSGGTGILLGIFASKSDEAYPGALMCSATFNNRVAAQQQVSITATVLQPGLHFVAIRVEASVGITAMPAGTSLLAAGGDLNNGNNAVGWRSVDSYAPFPATAPAGMDTSTPNGPPLIMYGNV